MARLSSSMPASLDLKVSSPSARVRATCPAAPTVGSNARTQQARRRSAKPREGANQPPKRPPRGPAQPPRRIRDLDSVSDDMREIIAPELSPNVGDGRDQAAAA